MHSLNFLINLTFLNENKKKEYSVVILFVVYIYTLIQISLIIRTSSACGSEIVLPWAIFK